MNYTTYLRWGVLAGLFLVPFIPFIIAQGSFFPSLFFPFITGKNFTFRILIEIVLLLYILLALREPQYRPRASWVAWAFFAFVAWMGLATALSVEPVKSFWSNFERMEGYIGLLHVFVYFVIASAMLSATNLWERFLNTTIAASGVMGFYALLQVFGAVAISTQSGPRVDTTFGNATYLAVYMLIHIFLTFFMMVRAGRANTGLQIGYGVALVLQLVALYFTETRGALLGLIGGLIVAALYVVIFAKGAEWNTLRRYSIGGLVAIAMLTAGFFATKDTAFVRGLPAVGRLASISLDDATTQSRLLFIWPMAIQGAMERPLTGWGQENFSYIFNERYDPRMYNQEQWFDRAHNQFLDWFVAGGIPALILYTSLYFLAAWAIFRSRTLSVAEQAVLFGLLAGYAFNNIFVFDNMVSAIFFATILGYAHFHSRRELPGFVFFSKPLGNHAVAIVAPFLVIGMCVGGWVLNIPGAVRAHDTVEAIQVARVVSNGQGSTVNQPKDTKENVAQFNSVLNTLIWPGTELGRQETVEQLLQYTSSAVAPSTSIDPQVKQEAAALAYNEGMELLLQRKGDARLELFMGTFLTQFGQFGEAFKHLENALALSPRKQQVLFQYGLTKLQAGDTAGALAAFKSAYELEPANDSARILYAAGHFYTGAQAAGDALLTEKFGGVVFDNEQLRQIYKDTKQWERVFAIWKGRIAKDEKNIELHLGLAADYFDGGRVAETIAELRVIAALDPNRALQMQNLITQLENGTLKPPGQ